MAPVPLAYHPASNFILLDMLLVDTWGIAGYEQDPQVN